MNNNRNTNNRRLQQPQRPQQRPPRMPSGAVRAPGGPRSAGRNAGQILGPRYSGVRHRSRAPVRILQFFITFALLLGVVALMIYLSATRTDKAPESAGGPYKYQYGGEKAVTVARADAVREGVVYVNFTKIADMCSLSLTGSWADQKYTTPAGEYVRFAVGTAVVSVNGLPARLSAPVRMSGDQLWVPLDFLSEITLGLDVTHDADGGTVTMTRKQSPDSTPAVPAYAVLHFRLKASGPIDPIPADDVLSTLPPITFVSDLSAYEQYMNPADRDAYLTLINKANQLGMNYVPPDLIAVKDRRAGDGYAGLQMREYAAKALEAFFIEMRANNITGVSVTSAYRSYNSQNSLFTAEMAKYTGTEEYRYAQASMWVAPPGTSEHQSGLCADMHNLPAANVSFADTAQFKWMAANAHKFGFILRYDNGKTDITGINYEPWHFRYVGRYHATKMYESGMCLEEYVASLK